ncbi:hypothetical protein BD779DRAFT_1487468 [Infundibulicybe gibba]|nr:hypothetical protein BD779DRAFT_1487468 [Infundibulicybe gibba]
MRLPFELIQAVVEQSADSRLTLIACTLVCKAWYPITLRFLFHNFTLRTDFPCRGGDLHAGLAFPHYVSHLSIYGSMWHSHYQPDSFENILCLFDHASSIRFCANAQLVFLLPRVFPHIRHLTLFLVSYPDVRSFHTLVASFPDLEYLCVANSHQTQTNGIDGDLGDLPPSPHLRMLLYVSSDDHRRPFLRWLSAHTPTLKHVTLHRLQEGELQSAGAFLRVLGSHLCTLKIGFWGHLTPDQIAYLPLHTNTNLRTLYISHSCITALGLISPLTLLDTDAPALRCVTLEVNFLSVDNWIECREWSTLDTLLAMRIPMLECLHVYTSEPGTRMPEGFPNASELQHTVAARMPHCVQTGVFAGVDWMPKDGTNPNIHGQ